MLLLADIGNDLCYKQPTVSLINLMERNNLQLSKSVFDGANFDVLYLSGIYLLIWQI